METEQERPLEQPVTDDKPTDETPSSDGPSMEDTIRDEYRRLTSSENADTGDDTTAAAPARARSLMESSRKPRLTKLAPLRRSRILRR